MTKNEIIMLKKENIICISSIDWDFIWQGHQEIMSTFAKNGNRVLFIENTGVRTPGIRDIGRISNRIKNWFKGVKGIRKEMDNLYVFSPVVLPFPYSKIARWINKKIILHTLNKWMKVMDFSDPIVWTFLPTELSRDIANGIIEKIVVYYCIDDFVSSSASAKRIEKSEKTVIENSDMVFVTSKKLYDHCSRYNQNTHMFPFGVSFNKFEKALNVNKIPEELKNIKKPIIGYIGGVHKWIDKKLVKTLSQNNKDCSFVFVGPLQTDISALVKEKNIHFIGGKDHDELPFFIKNFDICIIPYLLTEYTKNVYPTKMNEYLAMGKAVVSTSLPEVVDFNTKNENIIYVAENVNKFSEFIKKALNPPIPPFIKGGVRGDLNLKEKRISIARNNSWANRIEEMSELIETEIDKKKNEKESKWQDDLLAFYKTARHKFIKGAAICAFLWILVFKTPFVWFLAEPLKISDVPRRADVIVVFGGGVGEEGSPGKSTIERARYAVELYKKGYADKIIFSSGYTYTSNDAENMKLIALSSGVSKDDVILDQKGDTTYRNVKFSYEILEKQDWHKILLVSSPYNMRRVSLVFNKIANNLKVLYTPVPKSQFYNKGKGIKLAQVKAILHEYLGIVYYKWKGWI